MRKPGSFQRQSKPRIAPSSKPIAIDNPNWLQRFGSAHNSTDSINPSALRTTLLSWKVQRLAEAGSTGVPTPHAKKVYRLHLRTKRTGGVR